MWTGPHRDGGAISMTHIKLHAISLLGILCVTVGLAYAESATKVLPTAMASAEGSCQNTAIVSVAQAEENSGAAETEKPPDPAPSGDVQERGVVRPFVRPPMPLQNTQPLYACGQPQLFWIEACATTCLCNPAGPGPAGLSSPGCVEMIREVCGANNPWMGCAGGKCYCVVLTTCTGAVPF